MTHGSFASSLCQKWVRFYTSRLPREVAEQRRDEIVSDLWEHDHDSVSSGGSRMQHNVDVIGRVLLGIPADLSWRRRIQRSHLRAETGEIMKIQQTTGHSTAALIVFAGLGIATPLPFVVLLGTGLKAAEILWVLGSIALASVLALGLVLRLRGVRPVVSTTLIVIGAFAPSVSWFWLPPIYLLTVGIIVMAFATVSAEPRQAV